MRTAQKCNSSGERPTSSTNVQTELASLTMITGNLPIHCQSCHVCPAADATIFNAVKSPPSPPTSSSYALASEAVADSTICAIQLIPNYRGEHWLPPLCGNKLSTKELPTLLQTWIFSDSSLCPSKQLALHQELLKSASSISERVRPLTAKLGYCPHPITVYSRAHIISVACI